MSNRAKQKRKVFGILFVLTFMQMFLQTWSQCSAPTVYEYQSQCYSSCPWNASLRTYTFGTECFLQCPALTFANDESRSCSSDCPTLPILFFKDEDNNRCVQQCPTTPKRYGNKVQQTCVQDCGASLWADDSTHLCVESCPHTQYHQVWMGVNLCVSQCLTGFYGGQGRICDVAQNCGEGRYGYDGNHTCVQICPQGYFADPQQKLCVHFCPQNRYADLQKRQCVQQCDTINGIRYYASDITRQCQRVCNEGEFSQIVQNKCAQICTQGYGNPSTHQCVNICPDGLFAQQTEKICVSLCTPSTFGDRTINKCVSATQCSDNMVANPQNSQCVNECPSQSFRDPINNLCVYRCPEGSWGFQGICQTDCPWAPPSLTTYKDNLNNKCVFECPKSPMSFSQHETKTCVQTCSTGFAHVPTDNCLSSCPPNYFASENKCLGVCPPNTYISEIMNQCVENCPQNFYRDQGLVMCVRGCGQGFYADADSKTCVQQCDVGFFADNKTGKCQTECSKDSGLFAQSTSRSCVEVCSAQQDLYGDVLVNGNRVCVAASDCSGEKFSDPVTRMCVSRCPKGYFGHLADKKCYLQCPNTFFGSPQTSLCVSSCPQSPIPTFGNPITKQCTRICPAGLYENNITALCVTAQNCQASTYAEQSSRKCLYRCPANKNLFAFQPEKKCLSSCPHGFFSDQNTRKCESQCIGNVFSDPISKSCVFSCPSIPKLYAQKQNNQCVQECDIGFYKYQIQGGVYSNRRCVEECPAGYFRYDGNMSCVEKCPSGTYSLSTLPRSCVEVCPDVPTTLYPSPSPQGPSCSPLCPSPYFRTLFPNGTKACLLYCPEGMFGDLKEGQCVTSCPTQKWQTFGNPISSLCQNQCNVNMYKDPITKLCVQKCSSTLYASYTTGRCVVKCPINYFAYDHVDLGGVCVESCPDGKFGDVLTRECLDSCTGLTYFGDSTKKLCVQKCPQNPHMFADLTLKLCVFSCPTDTFADNVTRTCVTAVGCANVRMQVANPFSKTCDFQCPQSPKLFYDPSTNLCAQVCGGTLYAYEITGKCVQKCSQGFYSLDTPQRKCVKDCPDPFFKSDLTGECVSTCPPFTYLHPPTSHCVPTCPPPYFTPMPPSTSPCLLSCAPLYGDPQLGACVGSCPQGRHGIEGICHHECPYAKFSDNGICVDVGNCPETYVGDWNSRKCVKSCSTSTFMYADHQTKMCVVKCSGTQYMFDGNRTCLDSCPSGYYMENTGMKCVRICPEEFFANDETHNCVSDCTGTFTFKDTDSRKCVSKCSEERNLFGYNDEICVSQCPSPYFSDPTTQTCVQNCPSVTPPLFGDAGARSCSAQCSGLTLGAIVSTNYLCVQKCPDGTYGDIAQNLCVLQCPQNFYALQGDNLCVSSCPVGMYGNSQDRTCGDQCDSGKFKDPIRRLCVDQCTFQSNMFAQTQTSSCVLTCQSSPSPTYAYLPTRQCLSSCPQPFFMDDSTSSCVLQCPENSQNFADPILRKCTSSCVNHTISGIVTTFFADTLSDTCVTSCPETPQKFYALNSTNKCVKNCPIGTFADGQSRVCLDQCIFEDPKFTYMDLQNNVCVQKCYPPYFANNVTRSCTLTCPDGLFADKSTNACVSECPSSPQSYAFSGNNTCLNGCPDGTFANPITRTCGTDCPTSPVTYYYLSTHNLCTQKCPPPLFATPSSQCQSICPPQFYGNLSTRICESCRAQCLLCTGTLECQSCIDNYYLHLQSCVQECPIPYFAHLTFCVSKCPQPFYGRGDTGHCDLECPVKQYGGNQRVCIQCNQGCQTCDREGCYTCQESNFVFVAHLFKCSRFCNESAMKYYYGEACVAECAEGTYVNPDDLVTCKQCGEQCITCEIASNNCTLCNRRFLLNQQCIMQCPENYFVNEHMQCINCQQNVPKCQGNVLKFTMKHFVKQYKLNIYVIFNQEVSMTVQQFQQKAQMKLNNQSINVQSLAINKQDENTFLLTFLDFVPLNQNIFALFFAPGNVTDPLGNFLAINQKHYNFTVETGLTQQISTSADILRTVFTVFMWIFFIICALSMIKGGYEFMIAFECVQTFYMFIFFRINPIPYIHLEYLKSLSIFHMLFMNGFISTDPQKYSIEQYNIFLDDTSFVHNFGPFIFICGSVLLFFCVIKALSYKKVVQSKKVRRWAQKLLKNRLQFSLIHDSIWVVYSYTVFMALLQFTQVHTETPLDIFNIVFASIIFSILMIFTICLFYFALKYRENPSQLPEPLSFLSSPSSLSSHSSPPESPTSLLQLPLHYLRKLLICLLLLPSSPTLQSALIFSCLAIFFFYRVGQGGPQIVLDFCYAVAAGLYLGYQQLQDKDRDTQIAFAVVWIIVETVGIFVALWIFLRAIWAVVSKTQSWKSFYIWIRTSIDQNYLRQQQRKRDLQYDWGEIQSQSQKTTHQHQHQRNDSKEFIRGGQEGGQINSQKSRRHVRNDSKGFQDLGYSPRESKRVIFDIENTDLQRQQIQKVGKVEENAQIRPSSSKKQKKKKQPFFKPSKTLNTFQSHLKVKANKKNETKQVSQLKLQSSQCEDSKMDLNINLAENQGNYNSKQSSFEKQKEHIRSQKKMKTQVMNVINSARDHGNKQERRNKVNWDDMSIQEDDF